MAKGVLSVSVGIGHLGLLFCNLFPENRFYGEGTAAIGKNTP